MQNEDQETKLICRLDFTQVKIEVNTTMRGHILPVRIMPVTDMVQNQFKKFASIQVLSNVELFGGKVCAALDRQHPRDLFDIHYLLENEGFSEIKDGFIAALLSHPRPINEMLKPTFTDQRIAFVTQFAGMSDRSFEYEDFERTRECLIKAIHENLTPEDKAFLISFKEGAPNWKLNHIEELKDLPAVKWKLLNIQKLIKLDPVKHNKQLQALKDNLAKSCRDNYN